jgi:hypothetical protein
MGGLDSPGLPDGAEHWLLSSHPTRRTIGGGRPLKLGDGCPGDFSIDIQVLAYLAHTAHAHRDPRRYQCSNR